MRVDSLRPLMDGVPAHRAACGMIVSRAGAYAFPHLLTQNWSSQWLGRGLGQAMVRCEDAQLYVCAVGSVVYSVPYETVDFR